MTPPTPAEPRYSKMPHDDGSATQLWYLVCDEGWRQSIVCDEGWRQSIVCERIYEWSADWLVEVLKGQAYAPEHRP